MDTVPACRTRAANTSACLGGILAGGRALERVGKVEPLEESRAGVVQSAQRQQRHGVKRS
jgi:hypothetical protein